MKHLKLYETFARPVISYDFDGVLHRSVTGIHPHDFLNWRSWEHFDEMFEQMHKDAVDHDIVVVTARPDYGGVPQAVDAYIAANNLPVSHVYYTDDMPKLPILKRIGAIKHYDDNPRMERQLRGSGIEFQLVDPKLYESAVIGKSEHESQLARNKAYAKEYGFMIQGNYAVLFHGTNKRNMKAIMKSGMLRQGTWMTSELEVAQKYSRQAVTRAADAIVDTFVVYLGSLTYSPNDEGGYFQSNEDLQFKEGKYVPVGFKRGPDGDMNESNISEMMDGYQENGIVLLNGPTLEDGSHRLYGAQLKKVLSYDRKKMDGEAGQSAKMVLLHDDTFRIEFKDGKFSALKTSNGNTAAGISSRRIVLNNNKTPKHWVTTKYRSFPMLFKDFSQELGNMPDVKWYN